MSKFKKYWLFALLGVVCIAAYPIYMGGYVFYTMVTQGTLLAEHYPKYVIPYAPIALAVLAATALMPVFYRYAKKHALTAASIFALAVFFTAELLLESQVLVTSTITETVSNLEGWQLALCSVPPENFATRTWRAVDVLIGDYSPAFKIHFYLISITLILALLNVLYGFGQTLRSGNHCRKKALIVQSVCTLIFLGLCIFACFTAFFRDGELTVSPISAGLMALFFIVFGITAGTYAGSFLLGRKKRWSVAAPSVLAAAVTLAMYVGEMVLLHGHLYQLGAGRFFTALPGIVLSAADLCVIAASGLLNAVICGLLNKK